MTQNVFHFSNSISNTIKGENKASGLRWFTWEVDVEMGNRAFGVQGNAKLHAVHHFTQVLGLATVRRISEEF